MCIIVLVCVKVVNGLVLVVVWLMVSSLSWNSCLRWCW